MIEITSKEFTQKVLQATDFVAVAFYVSWCNPCKYMEQQAGEYFKEQHIAAYKVDVQRNKALAKRYDSLGLPTIILFGNGQEIIRTRGVVDMHSSFDSCLL